MTKKNKIICLITNAIISLSTIIITIIRVIVGAGKGQVGDGMQGIGYLKAFTNLSNIFNGIVALIALIYIIANFKKEEFILPTTLIKLQYISTVAVFLTFVTVVLFLTPVLASFGNSVISLYTQDMFHFHVFNPILSIVLLSTMYRSYKLTLIDNFLGVIPTFLYSILYITMILSKTWEDFYYFTFGGKNYLIPFVLIIMYGVTFLLGFIVKKIHNKKI